MLHVMILVYATLPVRSSSMDINLIVWAKNNVRGNGYMWNCNSQKSASLSHSVPDIQYGYNRTQFLEALDRLVDFWRPLLGNQSAEDAFHAMDYNYSPWPYIDNPYDNRAAYIDVIFYKRYS